MGTLTEIAWTDHTFNPWMGCTHVHAGCTNCYAESFAKRYNKAAWGPGGSRVLTSVSNWKKPLKWNEVAEGLGQRRKVFCASLADVFEDWQGPMGGDARCIETMDEARVGGESGRKRRDCGVEAIVAVVRQCQEAGVPCFVKQDCAMHSGKQGRIPDDVWDVKEFPVFVEGM